MTTLPNPIRVIQIATADLAVRFLLLHQLLDLARQGYQVTAVCSPGKWVADVRSAGIPIHLIPMQRGVSPLADLISLVRLYRFLRRARPHIVQTHTPKANLLGQLAAWGARVPVRIKTARGFYLDERWPAWKKLFYKWIEKVSSWCAHRVFVQSRADLEMASRDGLCPAGKLHYLGNGIDLAPFQPSLDAAATALRAELGFPAEAPIAGFVGRLTYEKGIREFIEAAGLVHRQRPDARFLAIGPEDVITKKEIEELVQQEQVADCFRYVGFQLDMARFYGIMTVLILPSYREGVPRAVMEAAAMSLPAVGSDIRGCRELIEPGKTGLLVPVRDSQGLANAILTLLNDPERTRAMGRMARQRAETHFDERMVFERLAAAYRELLEARPAKQGE